MQYEALTIGLCLPHSVCHPPEGRKHKEHAQLVWMRLPVQKTQKTAQVCHCSCKSVVRQNEHKFKQPYLTFKPYVNLFFYYPRKRGGFFQCIEPVYQTRMSTGSQQHQSRSSQSQRSVFPAHKSHSSTGERGSQTHYIDISLGRISIHVLPVCRAVPTIDNQKAKRSMALFKDLALNLD